MEQYIIFPIVLPWSHRRNTCTCHLTLSITYTTATPPTMSTDTNLAQSPTTIAILGSTGKTGRVVLRHLLEDNVPHVLNIYARSLKTLEGLFPGISSNPRVQVFIGAVTDHKVIEQCLSDAQLIIYTLGSNEYSPSTVIRSSSQTIATALGTLKKKEEGKGKDKTYRKPHMIYLSSSSWNERFTAAQPRFVTWLIRSAFQNAYDDLRAGQRVLLADPSLVSVLLVQPGVLVEEPGSGHQITVDSITPGISYEDLGAAFVELALERKFDQIRQVGVSTKEGNKVIIRYAPIIIYRITCGMLYVYSRKIIRFLSGIFS